MDVSKNRGTPKWMVKIMENPIKMDDLGVPLFLETPKCPDSEGEFLFSCRFYLDFVSLVSGSVFFVFPFHYQNHMGAFGSPWLYR